ncbi:MAG: RagB/SusD family nutrient uptake outer membrane protein [Paludibacter sp.]
MKNTLYKISLFLMVVMAAGCDSIDLATVDTKPNVQQPTEGLIRGILTSAYSTMTLDRSLYTYDLWGTLNGCDTDESFYKNTQSDTNNPGLHIYTNSTSSTVLNAYRKMYAIIEYCNEVIELCDKVDMNPVEKNNILGQAIAIRAYWHYMLIVNFGPIAMKIVPSDMMQSTDLNRSSMADVCNFAVKELRRSVPLLKEITKTGTTSYVTKSVAEGLSLRVGLFMASHSQINRTDMYDSVAVWGKKLIDRGVHSLNTQTYAVTGGSGIVETLPAYARFFTRNMRNEMTFDTSNPESMWDCILFSKSNKYGPYAGWGTGLYNYLGGYMGVDCMDPNYGTSKIGCCASNYRPQHTLFSKYEAGDIRKDWNIATYCYKNSDNVRYPYIKYTLPTGMGTPTRAAKLQFVVKGDKLVDNTIIEDGGVGYTDGTYTGVKVEGYSSSWVASGTPAVSTGAGTLFTITVSGGAITSVKMTGVSASGYVNTYTRGIGKWRREYEINYTAPREQYTNSCNFPILRYADVLLMTAEGALMASGSTPGAATKADGVGYLNQIRARAGLSTMISDYDLSYIQDERSRELCFEGLRRADLIRWGYAKYKSVNDAVVNDCLVYGSDGAATPTYKGDAAVNSTGGNLPKPVFSINALMSNYAKYSLLPIPQEELSRASQTFYQNPGW